MATSAVGALDQTATAQASTQSTTATSGANEQTFLELLVAQLKNQDPLNPTDGAQFVAELAQFSELEQVIAIRADLDVAVGKSSVQA